MIQKTEITLPSPYKRDFLIDIRFVKNGIQKPVIQFIHGFKGFKDWGCFNIMADQFANAGFVVVKMNFSHNGTTPDHPFDFVDLEAFGQNNFTKELDEMGLVTDFMFNEQQFVPTSEMDLAKYYMVGHSRGGGVTLLRAAEDPRIKRVVTFAAIHNLSKHWSQAFIDEWKLKGVTHVPNSRTNQNMPLYYQIVEDYLANEPRFDIPSRVKDLKIPILFTHGTADETLHYSMAEELHSWAHNSELFIIDNADHVFGAGHPFNDTRLPKDFQLIVDRTIDFLKRP